MAEILRVDSPETCGECGMGEAEFIFSTANSGVFVCSNCGALGVRIERTEGEYLVSYYHWYQASVITAEPEPEEEEEEEDADGDKD